MESTANGGSQSFPPFYFFPFHKQAFNVKPQTDFTTSPFNSNTSLSKWIPPWMPSSFPVSPANNIYSDFYQTSPYGKNASAPGRHFDKSYLQGCNNIAHSNCTSCVGNLHDLAARYRDANTLNFGQNAPPFTQQFSFLFPPHRNFPDQCSQNKSLKIPENIFSKLWPNLNEEALLRMSRLPCQQYDLTSPEFLRKDGLQSYYPNYFKIHINEDQENLLFKTKPSFFKSIAQHPSSLSAFEKFYPEQNYSISPNNHSMGSNNGSSASSSGNLSETPSPFEAAEHTNDNLGRAKTLMFLKQTFFHSEKKQHVHRCNVSGKRLSSLIITL